MENAVDALKIAFAVMVFTMALSLAISTFSQARETSEAILYMNDKTNYYIYDEIEAGTTVNVGSTSYTPYTSSSGITYTDKRIVGIEAIIPTLYRYYKENYTVIFERKDGTPIPIYEINDQDKWVSSGGTKKVNYFDLNSEIKANCPWVGTVDDIKKNLDLFLKGTGTITDNKLKSFGNTNITVNYDGFIAEYNDDKFLEQLGEYATDRTYGMNEDKKLEIQNNDGTVAVLVQNSATGNWTIESGRLTKVDGTIADTGATLSLEEIETAVGNNPTTKFDPVSGEIIELAKPTVKRVIKYTLIP